MTNISSDKLQKNIAQQKSFIELYRSELQREALRYNLASILKHVCMNRSSFGNDDLQLKATDCLIVFIHAFVSQKGTTFGPTDIENPVLVKACRNLHRLMLENVRATMKYIDYSVLLRHALKEISFEEMYSTRRGIYASVFPDDDLIDVCCDARICDDFFRIVDQETKKAISFISFDVQRCTSFDDAFCDRFALLPRSGQPFGNSEYGLIADSLPCLETPFIKTGGHYYSFVTTYSMKNICRNLEDYDFPAPAVTVIPAEPVAAPEPVLEEEPITVPEPVLEEEPVTEEPVAVEESIVEEEPSATAEPDSVIAEEPTKVEEPATAEEPVVEEPVSEEQPIAEEFIEEEPAKDEPGIEEEPVAEEPPVADAEPEPTVEEEPVAEEQTQPEPEAETQPIWEEEEEPEQKPETVETGAPEEPVDESGIAEDSEEEEIPFEEPEPVAQPTYCKPILAHRSENPLSIPDPRLASSSLFDDDDDEEDDYEELVEEESAMEDSAYTETDEYEYPDEFEEDDTNSIQEELEESHEVYEIAEEETSEEYNDDPDFIPLVSPDAYSYLDNVSPEEFPKDELLEEQQQMEDLEYPDDDEEEEEPEQPIAEDELYAQDSLFSFIDDEIEDEATEGQESEVEEDFEEPEEDLSMSFPPDEEEEVPPEEEDEPEVPAEPEAPAEPEVQAEPEAPAEPEEPAEPEPVFEPATETETEPEAPAEPEEPTEPEAPAEPEKKPEPEETTEPEAPAELEATPEPEAPTEPEATPEPEEATELEAPAEPEAPAGPEILPLLDRILQFSPSRTNPITIYLTGCDTQQQKDLVKVIETARKSWLFDGKDKMFSIPGTEISIAIFSDNHDPMVTIQRRENIGAVMYSQHKETWNSLELSFDETGQMVDAGFETISRASFSPWEWKIVEKLGNVLIERRSK